MKEKIVYIVSLDFHQIQCQNLEELNNTLLHVENRFLKSVENDMLIKEIKKEEYITYRNELGIQVQGLVKNYRITEDLLEYLLKLSLLSKSIQSVWGEGKENKEIKKSFYVKRIKVLKYLLEDVNFEVKVEMMIVDTKDQDV